MSLAASLVALALSAPPAQAPAQASPAPAARAPAPAACARYRVQAERNDLVPDADVAGWATSALERVGLHDPRSPCYLLVRITAGPTRTRGQEDGWVAHLSLSARRLQRDGKLVSRERGKLFIDAERDVVIGRVRELVEEWVASLKAPPPPEPGATPRFGDGG